MSLSCSWALGWHLLELVGPCDLERGTLVSIAGFTQHQVSRCLVLEGSSGEGLVTFCLSPLLHHLPELSPQLPWHAPNLQLLHRGTQAGLEHGLGHGRPCAVPSLRGEHAEAALRVWWHPLF